MLTDDNWFTLELAKLTLTFSARVKAQVGLDFCQPIQVGEVVGVSLDGTAVIARLVVPGRPRVIAELHPPGRAKVGSAVFVFPHEASNPSNLVAVAAGLILDALN